MEKVVVIFESQELTVAEYDSIMNELEAGGNLYTEKRISHVCYKRGDTLTAVDVWESADAFTQFAQSTLAPVFQKLGLNVPVPAVIPAHRYVGVNAEEAISA